MTTEKSPRRSWGLQLILNALLWVIPVALFWLVATPVYNRFLLVSAENLVRLTESPNATNLLRKDDHFAYVQRRDFPPAKSLVHSFRVTDVHFHLLMLGALFLAVPRVPWRRKLENLGWAVLITVFFDILLIFFYVKFVYATQLGAWSLEHYGTFSRNFWGLGKHLLDLPFKFSLPFLLWAGFYVSDLMAEIRRPRE
ncbi:MAG TPA: hypothetical protein VGS07_18290 [Thermoanaerobaculia bacterium]|jgi:hypothetical protein|nr:hypothetical protein [Thermoanaerobaculia bacterium]